MIEGKVDQAWELMKHLHEYDEKYENAPKSDPIPDLTSEQRTMVDKIADFFNHTDTSNAINMLADIVEWDYLCDLFYDVLYEYAKSITYGELKDFAKKYGMEAGK